MPIKYQYIFIALWLSWGAYWIASARSVKPSMRRESAASRWAHFGPLFIAALLLSDAGRGWPPLTQALVPQTPTWLWTAVAVTCAGLMIAIWARRHLGRNWSGSVTIKVDHELITSGPYRLSRHPIYTGLLLAFAGSALAVAEVRGLLAFAIAFAALWRKLKLEERFMRERFGQAYVDYSQRVAALVPFVL